jgi:hypothetical protein
MKPDRGTPGDTANHLDATLRRLTWMVAACLLLNLLSLAVLLATG